MLHQTLKEAALQAGAFRAEIITREQFVLNEEFRKICETGQCGGYDRCWVCPPYLAPVEELMEEARQYPFALWYQSVAPLEDSFDIEGMFAAGEAHAWLTQRVREAVLPLLEEKSLHLGCGGCHLCPTCAKRTGEPCRMPERALPSLEGYGFDVYQTTKSTSLRYINGADTVTYFGAVLFSK